MEKQKLTVLLVEDDADFAAIVQAWLSARQDVEFVMNWTDTLLAGVERIASGQIDIVILDLGLPDSNGPQTFHTLHGHAPKIPIVLLSGSSDEALAMELVRAGAQDYLIKEVCGEDRLVRALLYGVLRRQGAETQADGPQSATTIGILPAKGGLGATTFACTLTAELRHQTQQDSLLIDLDIHSNDVSFLLGLEPKYSLADALANTDRLDRSLWESIVSDGPEEIQVLTSAALYGKRPPPMERLRQMLSRAVLYYSWIVLDIGRLNEHNRAMLDWLKKIVVVTSTSVASLYQTKETLVALRDGGMDISNFALVAVALSSENEVSLSALEQIVPLPLTAYLPANVAEIEAAATNKELAPSNSRYRTSVATLARQLAGLPEPRAMRAWEQVLALGGIRRRTSHSHSS